MSEERGAPVTKSPMSAGGGADNGSTDSTGEVPALDDGTPKVATPAAPAAAQVSPGSPSSPPREGGEPGEAGGRSARESSPTSTAKRRSRLTLRIPDDEVARPRTGEGRSEPPPPVRSAPPGATPAPPAGMASSPAPARFAPPTPAAAFSVQGLSSAAVSPSPALFPSPSPGPAAASQVSSAPAPSAGLAAPLQASSAAPTPAAAPRFVPPVALAPPMAAPPSVSPPVSSPTSPSVLPLVPDVGVLKPMRIITINPAPPEASPPAPEIPAAPKVAPLAPALPPPPADDSWTPYQPTVVAEEPPTTPRALRSDTPPDARHHVPSEELIPIDSEPAPAVDSEPAPAIDSEPGPVIEVAPESIDADAIEDEPPTPPAPMPPARARTLTEPEGEEVRFEDDAPTPAAPAVAPAMASAMMEERPPSSERRSDPGAELAAEDLLEEPPPSAPSPAVTSVAPTPAAAKGLPPMRLRLESKPPVPPPNKKPPAAAPPTKPPLVIVPPHVGTLAPQPGEGAARRKGRLWWEDLFNDDYLRACERLTDEQIAREVDFVEDSLSIERGGTVLDLACGTGRHAIELARRGYEVVGFDLSLAMLARAGDEAQDREAKLNFIQGDMREMTFNEQFDGVYCWNTSFGYFEEEKNALVIDNIHRALKSEGLLLLDVVNRDFIIRQSPSLAWFEGDGCVCMDEMNVDFITSRMKVKRTLMLDDGRTREIEYSLRIYSLHELGRILHEHGFKVCEVSGKVATPSVFFGNESPRTLILAEKR